MAQVTEKARHYGIATALPEVTDPSQGLVLQYDLKLTDGLTCGGAYLKFLTADADVKFEELNENSTYSVMFGPDKCGSTNKVRPVRLTHAVPKFTTPRISMGSTGRRRVFYISERHLRSNASCSVLPRTFQVHSDYRIPRIHYRTSRCCSSG